jgi:outer membrane receptor protein involved in Fe transport
VGRLPYGFTFTNVTRYRAPYRALGDTRQNTPEGFDIYGEVKHPSALTFDWKISWETPVFDPDRILTLNLEVLNLFNRRVRVGNADDEYQLGRQFWAGVDFRF